MSVRAGADPWSALLAHEGERREPVRPAPRSGLATLERLEACSVELGPARLSALALARACLELAIPRHPAPHVLTTLWTLAEMLGCSERTVQRHLLEERHRWSPVVRRFFDFSHNYDTMPTPKGGSRRVLSGTVLRFFPLGRLSPEARVRRWGSRDLKAESEASRTRPSRRGGLDREPGRPARAGSGPTTEPMSSYESLQERVKGNNWVFVCLESLPCPSGLENPVTPYGDTPPSALPDAAFADLQAELERARDEGRPPELVRADWVERTARVFAHRLGDTGYEGRWRRLMWIALRAELHGGTQAGFHAVRRAFLLALDARREGTLERPAAWALELVRREGLLELERDHGAGPVGPRPEARARAHRRARPGKERATNNKVST